MTVSAIAIEWAVPFVGLCLVLAVLLAADPN
jgi:hypothetical protein